MWKLIVQATLSELRSNFTGERIESLPSVASVASRASSYESWVPHELPNIPNNLVIKDWSEIATGTHGTVRKVQTEHEGVDRIVCVKLFSEEWKDAYEREASAYALMMHRGVRRCIPEVYWKGALPISQWNGEQPVGSGLDESKSEGELDMYYGLVMEYFDDFKEIRFDRIDIRTAEAVGRALVRIHEARVLHDDMAERNILLVRHSGGIRAVWIDFSCAWVDAYATTMDDEWNSFLYYLGQGMVNQQPSENQLTELGRCLNGRSRCQF